MKSIQKVLWLFALCTNMLFFSKNANAQCSGFNVTASKTADGANKGDVALTATATGGTSTIVYSWYRSNYTLLAYGPTTSFLSTGTYCVVAYDTLGTAGCKDTFCLSIVDTGTYNCNLIQASISEIDSCKKNDVKLYTSVWGGSGSYSYSWSTGATSSSLLNRTTGIFSVIVTDTLYGCKDTLYKTVVDDTCDMCLNFKNSNAIYEYDLCLANDIQISAYQWGGSGSYSYLWNTGQTSQIITGKTTGNFYCIITDNNRGCKDSLTISVVDTTCNPCHSFKNFIREYDSCLKNDVKLTAFADTTYSMTLTYLWSTGAATQLISGLSAGSYWVKITNGIGCIDTTYLSVVDDTCNPCQNFRADILELDSCKKNDIKLTAYPQDSMGSTNYTYLWNTGATTKFLFNRGAGSYWVKVTNSNNGCVDTAFITVSDDTCNPCNNFGGYLYKYDSCQSNDIKIYAYAWGGSGNYSYSWNTGSNASVLTNRSTGWYKVTITDITNGCIYKDSIYAVDSNFKCCRAYFYTNDSAVASTKTFYGYSNVKDSIGGATTYTWNFGDGNTGTGQTKNHTYTSSGNKTVCLYINTASGCKDTFCSVVSAPAPGKNLKVSHYGIPYIKDTNRYTYITYQNIGTTTENGIVEYKYPAGMTLVSSTISPLTHIGNKISFSVGSLAPGASGTIYVVMKTPMSFTLGSIKCDTAIILPVSGDIVPANNTSYECDSVVASWDPNDKTPNPKGIGPEGNIPPATSEIGYLIRFENEGNWRTYRVRVEDEIDPSFDINSLMIGDASHAYRLVRKDNQLTWYFDNIELTPKSIDPNRSHGYIQYTLQLKPGLSLGTQLRNTAYIYFDANPAIITNTTKNTLKNADGTASVSRTGSDEMLDFDLSRNGDKLTVFSPSKMQALRIFDISGKLLLEKEFRSDKEEIENVQLSQGIYIVHVDIDNQTVIKKIKF